MAIHAMDAGTRTQAKLAGGVCYHHCGISAELILLIKSSIFFPLGSTSLAGPGSLVHLGSLKCIHPQGGGDSVSEGAKLLIHSGCSLSR